MGGMYRIFIDAISSLSFALTIWPDVEYGSLHRGQGVERADWFQMAE